jgi:hypothetical protein
MPWKPHLKLLATALLILLSLANSLPSYLTQGLDVDPLFELQVGRNLLTGRGFQADTRIQGLTPLKGGTHMPVYGTYLLGSPTPLLYGLTALAVENPVVIIRLWTLLALAGTCILFYQSARLLAPGCGLLLPLLAPVLLLSTKPVALAVAYGYKDVYLLFALAWLLYATLKGARTLLPTACVFFTRLPVSATTMLAHRRWRAATLAIALTITVLAADATFNPLEGQRNFHGLDAYARNLRLYFIDGYTSFYGFYWPLAAASAVAYWREQRRWILPVLFLIPFFSFFDFKSRWLLPLALTYPWTVKLIRGDATASK